MILNEICDNRAYPQAKVTRLVKVGEFSEDLRDALEEKSAQEQWGCVIKLIWVVQEFPNQLFVPVLSKLLDVRHYHDHLERLSTL